MNEALTILVIGVLVVAAMVAYMAWHDRKHADKSLDQHEPKLPLHLVK